MEGNVVSFATFSAFVAAAFVMALVLRKLGAPRWLIYAELVLVPISSVMVTSRIHEHFDRASCRHSADYKACMAAAHEAELPEWEPPTE